MTPPATHAGATHGGIPTAAEASAPRRLTDCTTDAERMEWIRRRLQAGETLTERGLRFAGVRPPMQFIEALRRAGMAIEGCRAVTIDRHGRQHDDARAWRMARGEA